MNKISLHVKKTELVVFKSKHKQFDGEIKLKLSHKRLFPIDSVKYLGVKIDGNLSWKPHIDYVSVKLSRAKSSSPLFKRNFILKFSDKVTLENTLFVSKCVNNLLPSLFNDWFLFSSDQHNYETSGSSLGNLHKPSYKNSIIVSTINAWNNSQLLKISLRHLYPNKIKKILSDALFQSTEMNCQLSDILN